MQGGQLAISSLTNMNITTPTIIPNLPPLFKREAEQKYSHLQPLPSLKNITKVVLGLSHLMVLSKERDLGKVDMDVRYEPKVIYSRVVDFACGGSHSMPCGG
jgi:hypothetical protein